MAKKIWLVGYQDTVSLREELEAAAFYKQRVYTCKILS